MDDVNLKTKKDKRFYWGLGITIGYLIIIAFYQVVKVWPYYPNVDLIDLDKMGSFLSGVFSPIAFLWLILAYLQQGEELQQNTTALMLQHKELQESVAHQIEQVDVATAQLKIFKEKETLEILRINHSVKPLFHLMIRSHGLGDGYKIEIMNYGSQVTSARVVYNKDGVEVTGTTIVFENQGIMNFMINNKLSVDMEEPSLTITYIDQLGRTGIDKFYTINVPRGIHGLGFHQAA